MIFSPGINVSLPDSAEQQCCPGNARVQSKSRWRGRRGRCGSLVEMCSGFPTEWMRALGVPLGSPCGGSSGPGGPRDRCICIFLCPVCLASSLIVACRSWQIYVASNSITKKTWDLDSWVNGIQIHIIVIEIVLRFMSKWLWLLLVTCYVDCIDISVLFCVADVIVIPYSSWECIWYICIPPD